MPQDPFKPKDDGRVKLPPVDAAMNKLPPRSDKGGGKGHEDDGKESTRGKDRKEQDDAAILARMRKRFDRCIGAEAENRRAALDDLKFKAGDHWPADVAAQRNADKRPMLTVNKMKTFVHQVTNDQRQNRPAINISPVGDRSTRESAKLFRGWIRCIERDSAADIAYDTAFDSAASMGWGYWRVLSEYETDDGFNQVLRVRRVRNPFTVYLDPDAQEPEGADARFGFVTEMMPREEFKAKYPDADPMPWTPTGVGEDAKNWTDKDNLRVAEYYEITTKLRTLVALDNGHIGFEDELGEETQKAIASGRIKEVKRREAEVREQIWYLATMVEIIDRKKWPGRYVPIVKVIGDEIDIAGKVKLSGVIRDAKDPQRMLNYWTTVETELIALAPKAPFIMEEGQVEGHESQWRQANTKSFPYLTYKGTSIAGRPAPPPQRQPFAGVPAGVVQAKIGAAQDMMATTGIRFDATLGERMTDESGRAIRELRRNSDVGSFHYIDNLARALKHTGQILIDLAPHYLDTKRVVTILREDDTEETVTVDPHLDKAYAEARDPEGKVRKVFNPKLGRYAVTVTIGPSYATKRIEAAESMMAFAKALPNTAQLIADLIAKNQDWPGADEMARRLAKAVPAQFLTPDQKDVPPQVQAVIQALDAQVKQLSMERQQLMVALNDRNADRAVAQDKVNKDFEAKLLQILQKTEDSMNKHASKLADQLIQVVHQQNTAPAAAMAGAPDDSGLTAPAGGNAAGVPGATGPQPSA